MAASRIASSHRLCIKYKFFFYVAAIILSIQLFIGYSFYSFNSKESEEWRRWHENTGKEAGKLGAPASESHSQHKRAIDMGESNIKNSDTQKKSLYRHEKYNTSETDENFYRKCEIRAKEPVSALNRAKSEQCRKEIMDTTCRDMKHILYPKKLPRYCPLKDNNGGEHLGCFKDHATSRDLTGVKATFKDSNTPIKCWNHCLRAGFRYAGVQYGEECWCGNSYGKFGRGEESECSLECPGDGSKTCGGYKVQNIYNTGFGVKASFYADVVSASDDLWRSSPARIVFVLTVNGRALRQVKRLFKALYNVNHYFYIHVDSRQDYLHRELSKLTSQYPNVRMSPWRMSTIWGGASLLQMLLRCMEDLLAMQDWHWDFFINLSESDYPVKTSDELTAFLTTYKKHNFLKSHGRDTPRFIRKQGLDKTFHECDTHMWRLGSRDLPDGIRMDGGSDWIALNRKFCNYVVHGTDDLLVGLKKIYKYTLLPAESFFHTVVQNSAYCESIVDNNLHLTNWRRKQGCKCQYKHIVDWCGCSPNDFKPDDWSRLLATKPKPTYFARKFEAIVSHSIIQQLDSHLYGTYPSATPGLQSYWQNDYHYLDQNPSFNAGYQTFYYSFARLGVHELVQKSSSCSFTPEKVKEVHLYSVNDVLDGILVLYTALDPQGNQYELETYVRHGDSGKMKSYPSHDPDSKVSNRLVSLEVGTDFDPKELIFRNFGGFLNPSSNLVLRHEWKEGSTCEARIAFIDPSNVVAASFDVTVKDNDYVLTLKPEFKSPLRPGVWTVKLLEKWTIRAEITFLVSPLSYLNDREVGQEDVEVLHNGPKGGLYKDRDYSDLNGVLKIDQMQKQDMQDAHKKTGKNLQEWTDNLVSNFWVVEDTCITNADDLSCPGLTLCSETTWSSRTPDPKSELGIPNPNTGRIR